MVKSFVFDAHWDAETGGVGRKTLRPLVKRAAPIALEMIAENRCADPGEDVIIQVVAMSTMGIKQAAA